MAEKCRMLIPDGSLFKVVSALLADAGMPVSFRSERDYRGRIHNQALFPAPYDEVIRNRPWDQPMWLARSHGELGFAGHDIIAEANIGGRVVIVREYPLSRGGVGGTRIVVAVPEDSPISDIAQLTEEHEVATEYYGLATRFFQKRTGCSMPTICKIHGSLEAYSAWGAIVENVETGASLVANGWRIIHEIMRSKVCLISTPEALTEGRSKEVIENVVTLLDSVMEARTRRLLTFNVSAQKLEAACGILPTKTPTVSPLHDNQGFAVQAVVPLGDVSDIVCRLRLAGATAILEQPLLKFVP